METAFITSFSPFASQLKGSPASQHDVGSLPRSSRVGVLTMKLSGPGGRGRRLRGGGGGRLSGGSGGGGGGHRNGSGGHSSGGRGAGGAGGPGSLSGGSNPFSRFASSYGYSLRENPIVTKALTSFLGFALASILIEGKDLGSIDWRPVGIVGLCGALVHGWGGHYYYNAIERTLPGIDILRLAGKTALDYFLWLPLISVALVLVRDYTQGKLKNNKRVKASIKSGSLPSPVWIFFSGAMYRFIGVPDRTLFYNLALVFSALLKRCADTDTSPVGNN